MERGRLILQDGTIFDGFSVGYHSSTTGEVVFTTGMVGYPESLTDPSYCGQILAFTYPLIGNYGVPEDAIRDHISARFESEKIQVRGVILAECAEHYSHKDAVKSIASWLQEYRIPALAGIDTRALTQKLREHGVMQGKIIIDKIGRGIPIDKDTPVDKDNPIGMDLPFGEPNTRNLVAEVSIPQKIVYPNGIKKVVVVDCGIKHNILRSFLKRGVTIIRVPWDYDFTQEEYDGLFISNGPGDPKQCAKTIEHLRTAITQHKPIFGICLGSQLLALAAGANTYKLKYGHRGQNQPCHELMTKRCYITSQNHGYAIDETTLPEGWQPWLRNVNDGTNEGIKHATKPFFAVQFHPEASPGPIDTDFLFDLFVEMI